MKDINNTPWPSFPSVKDAQDTLPYKVERLCILGGTEATASIYLSVAFIYSTKQIKPCDFLVIFRK
jgi:hypothetical protein